MIFLGIQESRSKVKAVAKVIFRNKYRSLPQNEIFSQQKCSNSRSYRGTFRVFFHSAVNLISLLVPSALKNRKTINMLIFEKLSIVC